MRYLYLVSLCIIMAVIGSKAQTSNYSFVSSSGTYTAISGTTLASGSALLSNTYAVSLPFTFYFNGAAYTSVYVALDGYVSFGNINPYPISDPISTSTTLNGVVAGFAGIAQGQAGTSLQVGTIGSSPNRVFVVQYTDLRHTSTINCHLTYQIRLNESNYSLQVVYGPMSSTTMTVYGQVGLRGAQNTDYYNRVTSTNWASTSSGSTNSGNCIVTSTVAPSSGLTFTWTPNGCPGIPAAGTVSAASSTVCTGQNTQVSISGQAGSTSLQWQISSDSVNWSNISGATSSTYNTAGITTTTYYRCRVTCNISSTFFNYTAGKKITVISPNTTVATIPYFQSFESNPWLTGCFSDQLPDNNWISSISGSNSKSWIRFNSTAQSSYSQGKYSPGASHGTISARWHTYNVTALGASASLDLYANFSQTGQKKIQFDLINPQGIDSFNVDISADNGQTWTSLIKNKTAYTTWTPMNALTTITDDTVVIRFRAVNNSTSSSNTDLGFDNLHVYRLCTGAPTASIVAPRDSACQNIADTLTIAGTSPAPDISMKWQSRPAGIGPFTDMPGATGNMIIINPTTAMDYRAIVKCLTTGDSTITSTKTIQIYPALQCFCTPKYQFYCNGSYYYFNGVGLTGEQNTMITDLATGCTGYRLYTADTAKLSAGGNYKVNIVPGGGSTNALIKGWIDFNDDGAFVASEQVGSVSSSSTNQVLKISIPANTPLGPHRFRMRVATSSSAQACDSSGGSGETHDYIVNITTCYNPATVSVVSDSLGICLFDNYVDQYLVGNNIDSFIVYPYGYSSPYTLYPTNATPQHYSMYGGNSTGLFVAEVSNTSGCGKARDTFYFYHSPQPLIGLSNPYNMCVGDTVNIQPLTIGAQHYLWSTGAQTPSIKVTTPGDYIFIVYSKDSCMMWDTAFVVGIPTASVGGISESHTGTFYQFSGINVQDATSYLWLLGDGNTTTGPAAWHTYAATGTYTVKLIVDNANGCGADTATLTVNVTSGPPGTSVDDAGLQNRIEIFPNPADEFVEIRTHAGAAKQQLRIMNSAGQVIFTDNETRTGMFNIDTRTYANGLYIVEIVTDNDIILSKFTIGR